MTSCVHFATRDDESAQKVEGLLEGLGYEARRDLGELDSDLFVEAAAAAARRHRLTDRERQMLESLLRGRTRQEMAEVHQVSLPTIKWHLHNIYSKLGVKNSEGALRRALFLDDARWLSAPLRHRDALDRVVDAAEHVVRVGKTEHRKRLDDALARLEEELEAVRRDAGLPTADEVDVGDEQVALVESADDLRELPTGDGPPTT